MQYFLFHRKTARTVAALPLSQTSHLIRSISAGEAVNYTGIVILLVYLLAFTVAASWFIYKKKNL